MGGNSLSAGVGWPQKLWGANQGGILAQDCGTAAHELRAATSRTTRSASTPGRIRFEVNNRWQFSDDLTWVKGRHTLKAGFEYRHHQFPFRGWSVGAVGGQFDFNRLDTGGYDASGNNLGQTGDPFASFLLGQVLLVEPDHSRVSPRSTRRTPRRGSTTSSR